MLDMVIRCGGKDKSDFVFFDTGIEYEATYEHLDYLEKKYGIEIIRVKPVKTIAESVKQYGVPLFDKMVSENIYYLKMHGFEWEDDSFENLYEKYGSVKEGLKWWTDDGIEISNWFAISKRKHLKEFMMTNPPKFDVSRKCCIYAKKKASKIFEKQHDYDLKCMGLRRSEGGIRKIAHKSCYNTGEKLDQFRPLWWFTDADRDEYSRFYDVVFSRCYTEYGLKRTGCVGCPYGDFEIALKVMKEHEPKLYKFANAVFGEAYEYTRQYKKFREEKERKHE